MFPLPMSKAILSSGHGHGTGDSELEGVEDPCLASLPVSVLRPEENKDEKAMETWSPRLGESETR